MINGDVWLVNGDSATNAVLWHDDGQFWTTTPMPSTVVAGWAAAAGSGWAVSFAGPLYHLDGTTWSPLDLGNIAPERVTQVAGTGPADVWAMGLFYGTPALYHGTGR